jgi:hypothetical protein
MQELLRPGFSSGTTFNISTGPAWSYFDFALGPTLELVPLVPVPPEMCVRKRKTVSMTFVYAQFVSFLKMKAFTEG